ncbi:MAG: hypothetical protein WBP64_12715 [Nitrososphaeraceae archaeon]
MDIRIKNTKYALLPVISFLSAMLFFSMSTSVFAHERQLLTIGGKPALLVVGSTNEPVYVGDRSGVDFFAYTPDPKDPLNDGANGTKPITGLEKTVKVEVSAGPKNKTLDFDPDDSNAAHYTATFFPGAQTTYTYTLTGTINNTPIHISYKCVPGAGDDTPGNNNKMTLSSGVQSQGVAGGFGCPLPKADATIP